MKNKVRSFRLERNMTQTELAKKAGLSLRTIQRIESGIIPKGFSLQSIARVFDISPEKLMQSADEHVDFNRVKIINLSALSFFILPFGNIILPSIITYRSKNETVRMYGKDMISIQIIWTLVTSILMIISPFFQSLIPITPPLFIIILVLLMCINVFIIIKNGLSLTKNSTLDIKLKTNIL
jgi:transcriptional regulator with XRE-family HTH domain